LKDEADNISFILLCEKSEAKSTEVSTDANKTYLGHKQVNADKFASEKWKKVRLLLMQLASSALTAVCKSVLAQ